MESETSTPEPSNCNSSPGRDIEFKTMFRQERLDSVAGASTEGVTLEEDHQASSFHSNLPASQIGKQEPENINIVADSNTSNSHNGPRRPRFASLEDFSSFLAEADPDHRRAQKWSSRRSVVLNSAAVTATSVFLANLIGTVVLNKVYGSSDIFRGDCQKASRLSTGIHVLLNILATLLLGASNLCMQLLIAPTRTEVDRAHQAFTWLDVGIPSFRNLPFVAMRRRAAWWILGFSSLPLHFLYNSAIFSTQPSNTVAFAVVTPDFFTDGLIDAVAATITVMGRQNMTLEAMDQMPPNNLVQSEVGANWGTPTHWDFNVSNQCGQDGCMSFRQRAQNGTFSKRLDTVQCLQTYVSGFGNRSDLLLVSTQDLLASQTPPMPSKNNSLLFAGYSPGIGGPGYYWECGSTNTFDCRNPSPWIKDPSIIENWNVIGYKIDYCVISETDIQGACSVQYSLPIMIIVCCANWCKCICIIYTALLYQNEADEPLASIGDAIRSFLSRPDPTTRSMCLIDKSMVSQNYTSRSFVSDKTVKGSRLKFRKAGQTRKPSSSDFWRTPHAQRFQRKHPRWLEAATRRRWCCTIISCVSVLILGIVFLVITLQTLQLDEGSAGYFVHLGFGAINQYAQGRLGLKTKSWAPGLYSDILLANIWQFLVSMLYVQYNPLLSCMLANREWHRYAAGTNERKPLRVSSPVGFQRSSYYISMPWRYGIPLLVTMAILHWILSQSVFVLPIETVRSDGTVDTNNHFSTVGFSIWPMISAMLVGLLLMSAVIICGLQRYQGGMPMGATCSAVISAACHQPLPHDKDAYRFPVQWGAVSHPSLDFQSEARTNGGVDESDLIRVRGHESRGRGSTSREQGNGLQAQLEPGHCCFTTARDAEPPRVGEFYA